MLNSNNDDDRKQDDEMQMVPTSELINLRKEFNFQVLYNSPDFAIKTNAQAAETLKQIIENYKHLAEYLKNYKGSFRVSKTGITAINGDNPNDFDFLGQLNTLRQQELELVKGHIDLIKRNLMHLGKYKTLSRLSNVFVFALFAIMVLTHMSPGIIILSGISLLLTIYNTTKYQAFADSIENISNLELQFKNLRMESNKNCLFHIKQNADDTTNITYHTNFSMVGRSRHYSRLPSDTPRRKNTPRDLTSSTELAGDSEYDASSDTEDSDSNRRYNSRVALRGAVKAHMFANRLRRRHKSRIGGVHGRTGKREASTVHKGQVEPGRKAGDARNGSSVQGANTTL